MLSIIVVVFKVILMPIVAYFFAGAFADDGSVGLESPLIYVFVVGAVPTAPALTAIIRPYGSSHPRAVIASMIRFFTASTEPLNRKKTCLVIDV